jgi:hypothetical protein
VRSDHIGLSLSPVRHPVKAGAQCLCFNWLAESESKSVSSRFTGRITYLLRDQEISNQQRRPPHLALAGHRATAPALPQLRHPCPRYARQFREAGPGFSTGLLSGRKGVDIPVDSTAGLSSAPHRRTGPRVAQRAILTRTRCATTARWKKPQSSRARKSRCERDFSMLQMYRFVQEVTVVASVSPPQSGHSQNSDCVANTRQARHLRTQKEGWRAFFRN